MKNTILKALQTQQVIEIMYIAKDGNITKRRVKVLKVSGDSFQVYCFTRHAKRTFLFENVLAVAPPRRFKRVIV